LAKHAICKRIQPSKVKNINSKLTNKIIIVKQIINSVYNLGDLKKSNNNKINKTQKNNKKIRHYKIK
jgi:hypothetical protein